MGQILSRFPMAATGGAELNFSVVAYVSEDTLPATAEENAIAIITDTPIAGYQFSVEEPTSVDDGFVWVHVSTASEVKFSATTENPIMIYPISAKQYVSGEWLSVKALTYQDGQWVEWVTYLYNEGETSYSFTAKGMKSSADAAAQAGAPTIKNNSDNIYISISKGSSSNGYAGIAYISTQVDLTKYSTLTVDGDFYSDRSTSYPVFCVWRKIGTTSDQNLSGTKTLVTDGAVEETGPKTIDVSGLNDSFYIGFRMLAAVDTSYVRIRKIYLS